LAGQEVLISLRVRHDIHPGETIYVWPDPVKIHLFDAETEKRIGE